MNAGPFLFLASFFALAISWLSFVLAPQLQLGNQQPVVSKSTGDVYPHMRAGMARQGEQVYQANGCYYCHTEQVRPKGFSGDFQRGWGGRAAAVQSVNEDYLFDRPVMLGSQRVGPDLANIGVRQTNENILLLHLYQPTSAMPKSVMPPYRYLFEKRKLAPGQTGSADAVRGLDTPGYEVVPKDEARQLVAYLQSLRSDELVFETPPLTTKALPATNAAPAITKTNNAPTNTPAK